MAAEEKAAGAGEGEVGDHLGEGRPGIKKKNLVAREIFTTTY